MVFGLGRKKRRPPQQQELRPDVYIWVDDRVYNCRTSRFFLPTEADLMSLYTAFHDELETGCELVDARIYGAYVAIQWALPRADNEGNYENTDAVAKRIEGIVLTHLGRLLEWSGDPVIKTFESPDEYRQTAHQLGAEDLWMLGGGR